MSSPAPPNRRPDPRPESPAPDQLAPDQLAPDQLVPDPLPPQSPPFLTRVLRRVLSGVLFILPVLITLLVIYQVYLILSSWLIQPVARLIIPRGIENAYWTAVEQYVTPPISLLAVFVVLYLLGYLFHTRIHRSVHWMFERIPGVSTLYRAILDVSRALQGPEGLKKIDTVVLVPFPHHDARMVGYLMGLSRDQATGEELACVYVPIGLFPPSGYTLVLPRDQVTVTDWSSTAPWKSLLSGGLTLPPSLPFHQPASRSPLAGNKPD